MDKNIKVLLLEDVATDAELELRELKKGGYNCISRRVDSEQEFRQALIDFGPDIVLSDFSLAGGFDGMKALAISRELSPEIPFIFVSGTIGEERAIESLKRGANDYVLKSNPRRLASAVQRAIKENELLRARKQAEKEIEEQWGFFRKVINVNKNLIFVKDRDGRFVLVNEAMARVFNAAADDLVGKTNQDLISDSILLKRFQKDEADIMNSRREKFSPELEISDANGKKRYLQTTMSPIISANDTVEMVLGVATDITELKKSQFRLATQYAVANILSDNISFEQSILKILEVIAQSLDFQAGILWETDEEDDVLYCENIWSDNPVPLENFIATARDLRIKRGQGVAGRVWESAQPIWIPDATRLSDFLELEDVNRSGFDKAGFHTVAAFPIVASGKIKGIVSFYNKRKLEPDLELLNTLSAIGSQVGQFMERKFQQKNIQRLNRIYAVLSGINTTIVRVRDKDKLFREVCDIAINRGRFLMAWLGFFDPENGELTSITWGEHQEFKIVPDDMNSSLRRARDRTNVKRILANRLPTVINRLRPASRIPLSQEAIKQGCLSAAAFPLHGTGSSTGLLVFYSEEADFFDEEEMRLLKELSADIVYAMQYLENEEKIAFLAYHDPLTGLLNRTALHSQLTRVIDEAGDKKQPFALLLLNINNFRDINDTLGHHNGDILLREVAQRLRAAVWDTDIAACLGGDDFAILLPHLANKAHIDLVINKIQQTLHNSFNVSGLPINVEATLGITLFPDHGDSANLLWQHADIALRTAKTFHHAHLFYSPDIDHYSPQQLTLIGDLRKAIDQNELVLHYQPMIDLKSGRTAGVEALVRWQHPQHGLIYPDKFIPFAERTGLINSLTTWVLANALHQVSDWHKNGIMLDISVNLSARNLQNANLVAEILGLVHRSGLPLDRLTVEITESAIMVDPVKARDVLLKLHDAGIRFSLDDFGTGQSSLTYLKDLPLNRMKIDKSFVMHFKEPRNAAIVNSAIELGHNLDLNVTAEGVEDEQSYLAIRDKGCDYAQGYYFSKPLAPDQLITWLNDSDWKCLKN